ncbi:MAG: hypothetical protein HKN14_15160 [Marinicaulis sp.]|nr:hypothetical protein [Marinicaulis sp.]
MLAALWRPVILGFAGAGLNYMRYTGAVSEFQEIADTAALAGAREYSVVAEGVAAATAQNVADKMLAAGKFKLTVNREAIVT